MVLWNPGDSNDLQDICHLSSLHPLAWVTKPQRGSSTQHHIGLMQHLSQVTHRRSLDWEEKQKKDWKEDLKMENYSAKPRIYNKYCTLYEFQLKYSICLFI